MILLLTDETWSRVKDALPPELYAELFVSSELPSDRDLIRMARRGEAPEAVTRVRAMRDAGIEAADQTRAVFNDLIRDIYGAGVPVATIARWFGVNRRRIYEAVGSDVAEPAAS